MNGHNATHQHDSASYSLSCIVLNHCIAGRGAESKKTRRSLTLLSYNVSRPRFWDNASSIPAYCSEPGEYFHWGKEYRVLPKRYFTLSTCEHIYWKSALYSNISAVPSAMRLTKKLISSRWDMKLSLLVSRLLQNEKSPFQAILVGLLVLKGSLKVQTQTWG